MPRKTEKNPKGAGRPRIPVITPDLGAALEGRLPPRAIDIEQVMYWMDMGGTAEEIAGSFHVCVETLIRKIKEATGLNFADLKEKCCGPNKLKLRKNQFALTEHNATMAIWLGKIWLGQKDNDDPAVSTEALRQFGVLMAQLDQMQSVRRELSSAVPEKDEKV